LDTAGKRAWLKSDWNKWVDEDEIEEAEKFDTDGMGGFDMGNMPDFSAMGGGGGEGGEGGEDSDDEGTLESNHLFLSSFFLSTKKKPIAEICNRNPRS
jgi:hypothetical protein